MDIMHCILLNFVTLLFDVIFVLHTADIFTTVLSLYMHGDGSNLPLPGSDEVLVCHSATTNEDVRIFNFYVKFIGPVMV
jgi:hypothetical protein